MNMHHKNKINSINSLVFLKICSFIETFKNSIFVKRYFSILLFLWNGINKVTLIKISRNINILLLKLELQEQTRINWLRILNKCRN